jgi:hypothetical protein
VVSLWKGTFNVLYMWFVLQFLYTVHSDITEKNACKTSETWTADIADSAIYNMLNNACDVLTVILTLNLNINICQ